MTRRVLALLALVAVAGCDSSSPTDEADPGWTRAGARLVYDYTPGPDSLLGGPRYTPIPATPGAVEMQVVTGYGPRPSREVQWVAAPGSLFTATYELPLADEDIIETERGIEIVVASGCTNNYVAGYTHYVRVSRRPADSQSYADCSLAPNGIYRTGGTETVTVPAGTFETVVVLTGEPSSPSVREYWSLDDGLVRLDWLSANGVLMGRFSLASSNRRVAG